MRAIAHVALAATLILWARPAAAQLCHVMPPMEAHGGAGDPGAPAGDDGAHGHHAHHVHTGGDDDGGAPHHVSATVTVEGATIPAGDYQGVAPSLMWHHDWVGAVVTVPAYRLAHDGDVAMGLGDVTVQAHARVLGTARTGAGLAVAVGLPTGSAEDRLGMGHVMAMPGAWGMVSRGRVVVLGAAVVGTSLGADAHAHHMNGGYPLVNPMNRLELGGSVRATYAATAALALQALGVIGVPLDDTGITRAAAGGGVRWTGGAWSATAEAQLGLAGDPFGVRGVLGVGRLF